MIGSVVDEKRHECTSCGALITNFRDARKHPILKTLVCSACFVSYKGTGDLSKYRRGVDLKGTDEFCRWCLNGGELILCKDEKCRYCFCEDCLARNLSLQELEAIKKSDFWYCFICDQDQLQKLRSIADKAIESLRPLAPPKVQNVPPIFSMKTFKLFSSERGSSFSRPRKTTGLTDPSSNAANPTEPVPTPAEPVITTAEPVITNAEPASTPSKAVPNPAQAPPTPPEVSLTPVEATPTPSETAPPASSPVDNVPTPPTLLEESQSTPKPIETAATNTVSDELKPTDVELMDLEQELQISDSDSDSDMNVYMDTCETLPDKPTSVVTPPEIIRQTVDTFTRVALDEATMLRKRIKLMIDALGVSYSRFDEQKFGTDLDALRSWSDTIHATASQSTAIQARCDHIDKYLTSISK